MSRNERHAETPPAAVVNPYHAEEEARVRDRHQGEGGRRAVGAEEQDAQDDGDDG
jgi:hypothetical protein